MNGLGERVAKPLDPQQSARKRNSQSSSEKTVTETPSFSSADRVTHVEITADEAGQRLDNYLFRRAKGVPKSHIYRIVRGGEVRVNGKRVDASRRLDAGDILRVPPLRVADRASDEAARRAAGKREKMVAFDIVFEDDALLVVDKPAGVAVHGGSGISFGVIEQLRMARPEARFLELVHRIDRDTSGLLMIAKKRSALVKLHEDLREGGVKKRYLACVAGAWPEARRQVKAPLVKFNLPDGERRVRVTNKDDPHGMEAHTIFNLVERFEDGADAYALLDVELRTGRTHQIRVHLAHLGRPIVGDDKYGDFAMNHRLSRAASPRLVLRRMFLHASALAFVHPQTGASMTLNAPLPMECATFLEALRRGRSPEVR
jgi:23S rRNA pseudouridine955/2504/2580 synthase